MSYMICPLLPCSLPFWSSDLLVFLDLLGKLLPQGTLPVAISSAYNSLLSSIHCLTSLESAQRLPFSVKPFFTTLSCCDPPPCPPRCSWLSLQSTYFLILCIIDLFYFFSVFPHQNAFSRKAGIFFPFLILFTAVFRVTRTLPDRRQVRDTLFVDEFPIHVPFLFGLFVYSCIHSTHVYGVTTRCRPPLQALVKAAPALRSGSLRSGAFIHGDAGTSWCQCSRAE